SVRIVLAVVVRTLRTMRPEVFSMTMTWWNRMLNRKPGPVTAGRRKRPAKVRPGVEELERRLVPTAFAFSTGTPDGRVATISEPPNAHNSHVEFESADDFALTTETVIDHASFTGLLTGGATLKDVSNVVVTIYRVFPNDSDVSRTSGPPTFSTPNVPTRVNSPSDVAFATRDSAEGTLQFVVTVLGQNFPAANSVINGIHPIPDQATKGDGPVKGH